MATCQRNDAVLYGHQKWFCTGRECNCKEKIWRRFYCHQVLWQLFLFIVERGVDHILVQAARNRLWLSWDKSVQLILQHAAISRPNTRRNQLVQNLHRRHSFRYGRPLCLYNRDCQFHTERISRVCARQVNAEATIRGRKKELASSEALWRAKQWQGRSRRSHQRKVPRQTWTQIGFPHEILGLHADLPSWTPMLLLHEMLSQAKSLQTHDW